MIKNYMKYRRLRKLIVSSLYNRDKNSVTIEFKSKPLVKLIKMLSGVKGKQNDTTLTVKLDSKNNPVGVEQLLNLLEIVTKVKD